MRRHKPRPLEQRVFYMKCEQSSEDYRQGDYQYFWVYQPKERMPLAQLTQESHSNDSVS